MGERLGVWPGGEGGPDLRARAPDGLTDRAEEDRTPSDPPRPPATKHLYAECQLPNLIPTRGGE